jgi:hypothetical protein
MDIREIKEPELDQYSEAELTALLRRIKRVIAAKTLDWKIGEQAVFNFEGCVRAGKIIKVNRRSVVVECFDGEYWVTGKALKTMIRGDG